MDMDIEKWYNNTLVKPSAKVIRQMIVDSCIEFQGIGYDAISLHLGESMTNDEIVQEHFEEIVYVGNKNFKKKKSKNSEEENADEEKFLKPTDMENEICCLKVFKL